MCLSERLWEFGAQINLWNYRPACAPQRPVATKTVKIDTCSTNVTTETADWVHIVAIETSKSSSRELRRGESTTSALRSSRQKIVATASAATALSSQIRSSWSIPERSSRKRSARGECGLFTRKTRSVSFPSPCLIFWSTALISRLSSVTI